MPLDNQREEMHCYYQSSTAWLLAEAANYIEAMIAMIRRFPLCFLSQLKRQTTGRMLSANWKWLIRAVQERGEDNEILDQIFVDFVKYAQEEG